MRELDLGGDWELRRLLDGSLRPIRLPGDILSALVEAREVADPYYGTNELELQWIGREDWLLVRDFEAPRAFVEAPACFLELEVLDTVAEIRLNGGLLATSATMFRRLRLELAGLLRAGRNRLEILIRSPERAAAEAAARLPYPVPCSTYPVSSPHRNLLRKAQCMAGWDWGPCLMTGGVYDGIRLVAHEGPRIEYVGTRTRKLGGGRWGLELELDLRAASAGETKIAARLAGPVGAKRASAGGSTGARSGRGIGGAETRALLAAGESRLSLAFEVEGVETWWPAGEGEQPLYELRVEAAPAREDSAGGDPAEPPSEDGLGGHRLSKRLGFRELELVAKEDAEGKSMFFRVNGRDIFAKGANWIPADALPSRWTKERYEALLDAAAAANMNCLRVWGGGRYEAEAFYEACDERGILVWQDLMFSCALYPSSPAFLAEVEAELRHQVRRLRDHPSLALWCGNNEALGAITWYEESRANPARYIVDYDRLTEGTAGRVVRELDPDRAWWPSSPSAGPDDFADNWHADSRGDMHYWSVWHEGKPFSAYLEVKPRFCSEFGFQSLPSPACAASFAPEGERNPTAPIMEHHQRHPRGNALIVETMARYFRLPRGDRELSYLSQVQQALAIRTAVEYWRSLRPRCMGTLYWQLNDVWPVASWSSLEYDGTWKLLHHEARRFYEPLHLLAYLKEGELAVVLANDGTEAVEGELELRFPAFAGGEAAEAIRLDTGVGPGAAAALWKGRLDRLGFAPASAFLAARFAEDGDAADRSGGAVPAVAASRRVRRSELFLTEPKRCSLPDPGLEVRVREAQPGGAVPAFELELSARLPAFFIGMEVEGVPGEFSELGFSLLEGESTCVRFAPRGRPGPAGAEAVAKALRVLHLRASYE